MRIILALILLSAGAAQAAEKGQARFSGGKMKSQSAHGSSSKKSDDSSFARRWNRGGARGRSSVSPGSGKVTYRANTSAFTRMGDDGGGGSPQDYGLSAPVAGAKVQPIGFRNSAGGPFSERTVEAGGQIAYDESKSHSVDKSQGVFQGPADKLPPVSTLTGASAGGSSGSGGASGKTGITANSPTTGQ